MATDTGKESKVEYIKALEEVPVRERGIANPTLADKQELVKLDELSVTEVTPDE